MKSKTKKLGVETISDADTLYLPLSQSIGSPAIPVVSVGDRVFRYQLLAKASGEVSSNVHAPVSGVIDSIIKYPSVEGKMVDTVVLKNDFRYDELQTEPLNVDDLTGKQILELIKEAGIVGEGGAQFPTHVKYDIKDTKIDTFIVNGAECEPYLTADYALMKENTARLFCGIVLVNKLLNAKRIVLGIEEQHKDLLPIFQLYQDKPEFKNIEIVVLSNEYPQGGELQLIKSVTGKVLPRNIRSKDFGVIVSNVGTVSSVYDAIVLRKPLVERIITISGEKSKKSGNFMVKIGTPISHILKMQGLGNLDDTYQLVLGGPMMGKPLSDLSVPLLKGSSGVLFLEKKKIKRNNCISCGYCVDVCPMHLMPMKFEENYRKNKIATLDEYNINLCIECSACEYICPSNVALIESIKNGKEKLKSLLTNAN